MPFVIENDQLLSFAEFEDVAGLDQRIFSANEGLSPDQVFEALVRASERILTQIRSSNWWKSYYVNRSSGESFRTVADIPSLTPSRIIDREKDFTDLCVFVALSEYILPGVADFGDDDSAERKKMSYYKQRADQLFAELIRAGDWYDFDGDGVITSQEKQPGQYNLKRVR